ncbi:MAG: Gfo/Idh/MocA family oxidoreductase [Treponema sp.]|jgi:predicted dehydrogenase|nr:Gfo/Idh/MocA family oxidoreductase [Treponema sp.]
METIKAAIVGLGRIASLLEEDSLREKPCTHAGAIAASSGCTLTAGCDIDKERRNLFAEKWQVPVYASATEMIRTHSPQILVIATHPDSHWRYCRLAAGSGVPAVICEKPLAGNISDARKIERLAHNGGITIITNHERRYSADYIRAKSILDEETLGRLLSIRAVLYMGKNRRLIDVFWHDGTHLADIIMFLSNGLLKHRRRWGAKLTARAGTAWLEGELVFPASAETGPAHRRRRAAPIPVIIETGAERDYLAFEIECSCEQGRLRIGNGVFEVWESSPSPYAEQFKSLKQSGTAFSGPTGYFANMVQDAALCVTDPERRPRSSAADGLRVIEYLNSVKKWDR